MTTANVPKSRKKEKLLWPDVVIWNAITSSQTLIQHDLGAAVWMQHVNNDGVEQ